MPSVRAAIIFFAYCLAAHYGLPNVIPAVNSLSASVIPPPPSKNPDVLASYVFGDEARCWEVVSPSDQVDDDEEDEVEYWYPTRKRHFEFSIPSSSVVSRNSITIRQTSFGCGKLGAEIWDTSLALCLYLGQQQQSLIEGKRILELGAGCGLPSALCRDELKADAILATDFWETETDDFDKDRLVPTKFHGLNLEHNVCGVNNKNNSCQTVVETAVQRLDWHDRFSATSARDSFRPDLVIGSDLVYYPMDVEPLLDVLEILLVGDDNNNEGDLSSPEQRKIRAVLSLPLAPAEREALPEFRSKLPERFSKTHTVTMQETDLIREDTDGENSSHLMIDMVPK